jgi:hypothetical protein
MQSSSKQPAILRRIASQRAIRGLALVAGLCIFGPAQHAAATWLGHGAAALIEISNDTLVTEVATRGGRAGGARVARAGGVRAGRGVAVRGGARGVAYRGGVYRRGVGVGAAAVGAAAAGAAATGAYYSGYGPGYGGYGSSYGGYGPSSGYGGYGASTVGVPGTASTQRPTFEEAWKICTPYAQQIGDWNVQGRTARGKSCMLRYGYTI